MWDLELWTPNELCRLLGEDPHPLTGRCRHFWGHRWDADSLTDFKMCPYHSYCVGACTAEGYGAVAAGHLLCVSLCDLCCPLLTHIEYTSSCVFVGAGARTAEGYGASAAGHMLSVSVGDLLPRDASSEGAGRSACQVQQTDRHAGDWRRCQRRQHDQEYVCVC